METTNVNRNKLRNLFLMHQDDLETKIPELAKELKYLLNIRNSNQKDAAKLVQGVDKKFAQDLSKKFFNNFHKEQFEKNEQAIQQRYEEIEQEIDDAKDMKCMKTPKTIAMKGQKLKKHKHKLATLTDPLSSDKKINVPNKYFCVDCGIHHYNKPRECEHCGVVHPHCCEVY